MRVLSEEFLAHDAHRELPALTRGFDGRIRWIVDGAPDGKIRVITTFEAGRVKSVQLGNDAQAELTLTIRYPDLIGLLRNDIDLNALFIAGDLKTDGPTGPLLDLIVAVRSEPGQAVLRTLSEAVTET